MPLRAQDMRKLILADGHLRLEGDESTAELREALLFLYFHYPVECRLPNPGPAICDVIEPKDLAVNKAGRPRKIKDTDPL